jgi:hypothetical protein
LHHSSPLTLQQDNYNPEYQESIYQDRYSTPATSPPTPSMNRDMPRTRSGFSTQRNQQNLRPMPEERSRAEKSPKAKKAKKDKVKAEKKVAKLEKPLSELTKDWTHVPVADIETYVNRSAEERRREVEDGKFPGKVKRPMNSFMLYRKAYQNRTKDWCLQNNHQVVSQVCGDSWPLEPDSVKEQFSEWARIERQNHQNAHPGYKFSPTKPGTTKAPKRKVSEEPMSEESDLDDFDWHDGLSKRLKRPRSTPRPEQPISYPTRRSAYGYGSRDNSMEPNYGGYDKSSYQATNPGKPLPAQYNQADLRTDQYYQQIIQSNPNMANVEDVIIRKAPTPGVHSYLGLPGGQEYDMMNPYPQYGAHPGSEQKIDPSLMPQEQIAYGGGLYNEVHPEGVFFGGGGSQNDDQQWQSPYDMKDQNHHDPTLSYIDPELAMNSTQIHDQHMHVLRGHQEGWHVDSLDESQEFDNWMNAN